MDLFESRTASPMLIAQQMEAFDDPEWIYELKLDGFRCLAYVDKAGVDFRNKRNMQMLPRFPELKGICRNVKDRCILDGEIVTLVDGVPDFYHLQKRTMMTDRFKIEFESARYPASFVAFDCIYQGNREFLWEPLLERKRQLAQLVEEDSRIALSRYIEREGRAFYAAADARRLEGVVAKRSGSLYLMGKRTKDWIKFKRMADEEFIVAGYLPKGGNRYSLVLAKYRKDTFVYKGHVTAGVTRDVIEMLDITGRNPFQALPVGNEAAVWVRPEKVCTVEYMPSGRDSLRQPVFKGFREDVVPEEVQVP